MVVIQGLALWLLLLRILERFWMHGRYLGSFRFLGYTKFLQLCGITML